MNQVINLATIGLIAAIWSCSQAGNLQAQDKPAGTRMLSQPAVSATHIAFSYDRDLWVADRDGSNPQSPDFTRRH